MNATDSLWEEVNRKVVEESFVRIFFSLRPFDKLKVDIEHVIFVAFTGYHKTFFI
jgi:hypothetical protein